MCAHHIYASPTLGKDTLWPLCGQVPKLQSTPTPSLQHFCDSFNFGGSRLMQFELREAYLQAVCKFILWAA